MVYVRQSIRAGPHDTHRTPLHEAWLHCGKAHSQQCTVDRSGTRLHAAAAVPCYSGLGYLRGCVLWHSCRLPVRPQAQLIGTEIVRHCGCAATAASSWNTLSSMRTTSSVSTASIGSSSPSPRRSRHSIKIDSRSLLRIRSCHAMPSLCSREYCCHAAAPLRQMRSTASARPARLALSGNEWQRQPM
jgi:hypothetical protein